MSEQPRPISRLSVLVADPSPHMATLVAGMLRMLKVRDIREVSTTTAVVTELKRTRFDILVIDDGLKPLSSIEFVRKLRAAEDNPGRNTPIIMMSAAPGAAEIKAARDAGVDEFLRKPFAPQHLEMRIKTLLNAPRPFIAAPAYTGPDRRRRNGDFDGEERRGDKPATPAAG